MDLADLIKVLQKFQALGINLPQLNLGNSLMTQKHTIDPVIDLTTDGKVGSARTKK